MFNLDSGCQKVGKYHYLAYMSNLDAGCQKVLKYMCDLNSRCQKVGY